MQTFIYIATTQGPVRVQAITEEDPDIKSVVCLDGLAEPLAISDRYHDFVKKGTGLIHREFGHGSYRVDVDKPIDQGDSWQLGLYCAHILQRDRGLCNRLPESGDRVFLVTGRVKSNGGIAPVDKVEEKRRAAEEQINEWQEQGVRVERVFPFVKGVVNDQSGVRDHYVENISELPHILVIEITKARARRHIGAKLWLLIGAICILSLLGLQLLEYGVKREPFVEMLQDKVKSKGEVVLKAHIADGDEGCEGVTERSIDLAETNRFQAVAFNRLCGLYYQGGEMKRLFAFSRDRFGMIDVNETREGWNIPIPFDQQSDRHYILIELASENTVEFQAGLRKQLLRWGLQPDDVSLLAVTEWVGNQPVKARVYGHTLLRGK